MRVQAYTKNGFGGYWHKTGSPFTPAGDLVLDSALVNMFEGPFGVVSVTLAMADGSHVRYVREVEE